MPARSMVSRFAGCSTAPFEGNSGCRNDPLYRFHEWQANLRILEVTEIQSIPYVPRSHPFVERLNVPFDASIWITCCSGRLQILKTSCSISEPTSTTIARIPHEKGERPIRRCHDRSPISARFDGNPTADPCIRPPWLPDLSKTRARCDIRSTSKNTWNEIIRCLRSWLQSVSRTRSFHCHQVRSESEAHLTFAARLPAKSAQISIRQIQLAGHTCTPWQTLAMRMNA
jgi:hypothetical protein